MFPFPSCWLDSYLCLGQLFLLWICGRYLFFIFIVISEILFISDLCLILKFLGCMTCFFFFSFLRIVSYFRPKPWKRLLIEASPDISPVNWGYQLACTVTFGLSAYFSGKNIFLPLTNILLEQPRYLFLWLRDLGQCYRTESTWAQLMLAMSVAAHGIFQIL